MELGAPAAKSSEWRLTHRASSAGTCCTAALRMRRLRTETRGRVSCSWATAANSSSAGIRRHHHLRPCCRSKTCLVLAALLLMAAAGCEHKISDTGNATAQLTGFSRTSAPEEERPRQLCSDFGETRVCYDGSVAR